MDREDYIRRAMIAKEEKMVRALFSNATESSEPPPEPLTLDKLRRLSADLRAEIGPTPVWLSSKLFPSGQALTVEGAYKKFTCAHPTLWRRVTHEISRDQMYESPDLSRPIFGISILEIDIEDDMSDDQKAYLRGVWAELMEAFKVAMVPLPEWLRAPPKFGKHG